MAFQKECPYCGKEYNSKHYYKKHLKKHKEESETPEVVEVITRKPERYKVKYREVVYVGTADQSTVRGAVTGKKYIFTKDMSGMPKAIKVDERDYPGIIALKGRGCARKDPNALFMSKQDWDLEIQEAKRVNR